MVCPSNMAAIGFTYLCTADALSSLISDLRSITRLTGADVSAEIYEKIYNFWALIFQWTIEQQVPWGFAPSPVI
jgi:hypothetical protein